MAGKWGAAWGVTSRAAAERLGDDWLVVKRGGRSMLIRQPIGWWLPFIGFEPQSGGGGYLTAGYRPLTEPMRPTWKPFGFRQDEYYADDRPAKSIEPGTDEAVDVTVWWATGPATRLFEEKTTQQRVAGSERMWSEMRDFRMVSWTWLAGARAVLKSGDPVEIVDTVLQAISNDDWDGDELPFWRGLREAYTQRGRWAALEFLDGQRRAGLAAEGVPESAVADVLGALR